MAQEALPEVISFRSLFLPQGPLIILVGGTGGQRGGGWRDAGESLHVLWRSESPWEFCVCVCVWHDGGECLLAILLQQFKRCVKNTWIINPICTRHVWVCVRECETQNAFERCDWKPSFQRVNVGVLLRLHAQQLPVCPQSTHSCYLWRTPDKHIRMYSCRLRLCSQNCTISFSATGSLLKRLWEVVICIHQEKCNQ